MEEVKNDSDSLNKKAVSGAPKKNVKKKTTGKTKGVKKSKIKSQQTIPEGNHFNVFAEKTSKFFDVIIDEVRDVTKKTTELSKNSHVVDSIMKVIKKTKQDFIQKKDELIELHKLNAAIASNKRKLVELYIDTGKKTIELLERSTLNQGDLDPLYKKITDIKNDIKHKEQKVRSFEAKKII